MVDRRTKCRRGLGVWGCAPSWRLLGHGGHRLAVLRGLQVWCRLWDCRERGLVECTVVCLRFDRLGLKDRSDVGLGTERGLEATDCDKRRTVLQLDALGFEVGCVVGAYDDPGAVPFRGLNGCG